MYALETCKRDSISLPNLCIMKKRNYWEAGHALLERNFLAQRQVLPIPSIGSGYVQAYLFMCPRF